MKNTVSDGKLKDALCFCEYDNVEGQRQHILAMCCECDALDVACDRFCIFQFVSILSNVITTSPVLVGRFADAPAGSRSVHQLVNSGTSQFGEMFDRKNDTKSL